MGRLDATAEPAATMATNAAAAPTMAHGRRRCPGVRGFACERVDDEDRNIRWLLRCVCLARRSLQRACHGETRLLFARASAPRRVAASRVSRGVTGDTAGDLRRAVATARDATVDAHARDAQHPGGAGDVPVAEPE